MIMATSSANTLEDLVTCNICMYKYDDGIRKPKFLPCSHTICLECFQTVRQGNTITCPFCRKRTSKDNGDGAEWILPTNPYVLELLKLKGPEEAVHEEDEEEEGNQFMTTLGMKWNSTEMEVLNEAMGQSLLSQQQKQKMMVTAAFMEPSKEEEEEEQLMMALAISGVEM